MITEKQKNNTIKLLQAGYGICRISKIESVSKTAIYKIIDETGIREKRGYAKMKFEKQLSVAIEEAKSNFICPGIGNCGGGKRMFQYPCLLGYDS